MSRLLHSKSRLLYILLYTLLLQSTYNIYGQTANSYDTLDLRKVRVTNSKFINNIFQQAVNSVTRTPGGNLLLLQGKSEVPYLPYHGKIIRKIYVVPFNFDRSFSDTTYRDRTFLGKLGKSVHTTTKPFVVRNNLFIKENTPVNAYKVADNERYLRTLDFIADARIMIEPVDSLSDSVDVIVFTKDFFPISGGAASNGFNHITTNLYNANIAGIGQRLEATTLYDYNRDPYWGFGGLARKSNVAGSYIDATVGYSTMNISPYTHEEETVRYFSLGRRLTSPYARFAGGFVISENKANNKYNIPDSFFYQYHYRYLDIWTGYNVALGKLTATNNSIRDRRFFSLRYYNRDFTDVPYQIGNDFHYIYNSSQAMLAQMTFFRQDYYKTQYVYGFGTTEDLPYGYNISVTGGWHKQLDRERPYMGASATQYIATNKADFLTLSLRLGGFLYQGKLQDAGLLIGASGYSRLMFLGSTKIRQYAAFNFTYLHNRVTSMPLRLNNDFGLRGFLSDSIIGNRRLSLQLETSFYLKWRLWGFQFAPFPYADFALIAPGQSIGFNSASLYTSLGGGVRMRNESLVFETIEIRAFFFPVAPSNMRDFKVIVTANLRYRYPSSYIAAPDLLLLN